MGVLNFGRRAGAEVQNFGRWPIGPHRAGRAFFGHNKGFVCGARETVTNPAQPMAPAVLRDPWAADVLSGLKANWHLVQAKRPCKAAEGGPEANDGP